MSKAKKTDRTFANGRKPLVAGSRLETELAFYGCEMDPGEFNDLLAEMLHNMAPSLNPEQMMYYPISVGTQYVRAIRARSSESLPEEMILRRLRNLQKKASL